jgi:hypothetical protein
VTQYLIDEAIILRDGPFAEFKQDVSIVDIELTSGKMFKNILILYPNQIIGMEGSKKLPFEPKDIKKVFQDNNDLKRRGDKSWLFS